VGVALKIPVTFPQLAQAGDSALSPTFGQLGGGWIAAAQPGLAAVSEPLVVVAGNRERTDILILSETGQAVVGSLSVADEKPFIAVRHADRTLLVSDAFSRMAEPRARG
jgi:hypothetical protein